MSARHCTVVDGSTLLGPRSAGPSFDGLLRPVGDPAARRPSPAPLAPAERRHNDRPATRPAAERFSELLVPSALAIEPLAIRMSAKAAVVAAPGPVTELGPVERPVAPGSPAVPGRPSPGRASRPSYLRVPALLKATMAVGVGVALAASALRSQGSGDPQAAIQLSTGGPSSVTGAAPSRSGPAPATSPAGTPLRAVPVSLNGAAQVAAVPSPGARHGGACRVTYTVTPQPPRDVLVQMKISNAGPVPVDGWAVAWSIPSGFGLVRAVNATVMTNANGAVATAGPANRLIPPGGSTSIGFVGRYGGQASAYLELAPKGVSCA